MNDITVEPILRKKLRDLTRGTGVRRARLYDDLGAELRTLWHVRPADSRTVLDQVTWQLERLIRQLPEERLRLVARVSFNITEWPELRDRNLGARHEWLYRSTTSGPSPEVSRRCIADKILPAFEQSIRTVPPPAPAVRSPEPPAQEHPQPARSRRAAVLAVVVGLIVVAAVYWDHVIAPQLTTHQELGGDRHGSPTFTNPYAPSVSGVPVAFLEAVEVSCQVHAVTVDGNWYRIASPPWNNRYYAPANTFVSIDPTVPDC
jgi:hypothetical protein